MPRRECQPDGSATQCREWCDFADGQVNIEKDRTTNGYDLTIDGVLGGPIIVAASALKFDHARDLVYAEPLAVTGVVYNAIYDFYNVQGSGNYDIGLDVRNYASGLFPISGIDFGETVSILGHGTGVYELASYSTDYIKLTGLYY